MLPRLDVDVIRQAQRHGHRRKGLLDLALERVDRGDRRVLSARQHDHLVARSHHSAGELARVGAVVRHAARRWTDHPLDGEAHVDQVAVGGDVDVLEVVEQRRPLIPGHRLRAIDHVVAEQRRDRDERHVGHLQAGSEAVEVLDDRVEDALVEVHEVHLVDAHHDVRDAEQRADEGMALGLRYDALASVDEHDRQVGRRSARDHVARVLLVSRRVGDDEAPLRGREIAVGDVDRDALLALRPQPVGQQREVDEVVAHALARRLHLRELVAEHLLGVVEQPADQRALAVVHRAGCGEPQQVRRALGQAAEGLLRSLAARLHE